MIFSSYRFIFLFLPVTLLGYHLLRQWKKVTAMKVWLVAASLVFYAVGQPDFVAVFLLSILLNFLIVQGLGRTNRLAFRRTLLTLAVAWNIGLLVYFKYSNFFLQNINFFFKTDFPLLSVILPIGISFFTFQILMYTVSYYRGECEALPLLEYALFISFFPQLIVGPVVKEEELAPQISGEALLNFESVDICRGVMLFSVGCAKKILLATPMIDYATAFYGGDVTAATTAETWMGVVCYTFAYYFDFSGYIDMARGLGCFFGVHLPVNFDSPYKATDFASFWRRWNMTISRFFNEYVFDNVFHFGDGVAKLLFAVLLTFTVSGLWHGAGWHYIAWGLANGVFVCIANLRALHMSKPLPKPLAVAMTFFCSMLIRVLFDCTGLTQAFLIYRQMFTGWGSLLSGLAAFAGDHLSLCLVLVVSAVITFALPNSNSLADRETFTAKDGVWAGALLAASLLNMSQVSTFLYFNF
jgi:D-alanyl-lipoteichoic acid acyltransferase DltB (MBOAT superfamily)